MTHLLFLSHAGADTERAVKLAAAIEASPDAQAAGLKVWVDKRPDGPHRLHAGAAWQDQLETVIATDSTSFGLLLTREGARNWVRLEVRVALDRVIAEQRNGATYPFVPIIADDSGDLGHLPPFAQQYQGVRLTEDGSGLADLVRVAARLDAAQPIRLVAQPFMGLEAFEAKDAALFFGRRKETQELVDRLRTTNLVLITGDSGSGKSSLVKAGLIPAFREGALADPLGRRPEPGQWHVVEMRPGTDPFEGLVEGAQRAATAAGIAPEMILALGTAIRSRDPGSIRDALRLSGRPGASLLLVVDQFEELWTLAIDDTKRRDFLATLLALVPEGDLAHRVVGTMRRDYYHLHTDDERLHDRLAAHGNAGRFLLGAMVPAALRDIVEKPLLLAGESEARAAALADEVVKDVAGEPGNLALVEMALHESWERRYECGGDLALAYQRLDRLEGALARAAEEVFWNPTNNPKKLTEAERPVAEALFMRLVRAGNAGGATRRPVTFTELEEPVRAVARKLATPNCRRLLVLCESDGGDRGEDPITVELAHEQLVTQWPDYRFWLRGTGNSRQAPDASRAANKRALDRLIDASANWNSRGREDEDLARGGDFDDFTHLQETKYTRPWIAPVEHIFLEQSILVRRRIQHRQTMIMLMGYIAALALFCTSGLFVWKFIEAKTQQDIAERRFAELRSLGNLRLGTTNTGLDSRNSSRFDDEYDFGNLVADSFRAIGKTDIAIFDANQLRAKRTYEPGTEITVGDLINELPWSDRVVSFELSGQELLNVLGRILSDYDGFSSQMPRVSGVEIILDLSDAGRNRITNVRIDGHTIRTDKLYSIAMTESDADENRYLSAYSGSSEQSVQYNDIGVVFGIVASYISSNGAADANDKIRVIIDRSRYFQ